MHQGRIHIAGLRAQAGQRVTDVRALGPAALGLGAFALTTFLFPLVGVLIATRRPGNSIAWLLLGIGLCWGLDAVASSA